MSRRLAFVLELDADVFAELARDEGWIEFQIPENSDEDRPARAWHLPGSGQLRFVDDTSLSCQYVEITGGDTALVERPIRQEFTCYDRYECAEIVDLQQPEETVCRALQLLSCTAPGPFNRSVFDAAVPPLTDSRENVRIAAVQVAFRTMWPDFQPHISRLASDDVRDRVRMFVGNAKLRLEVAARQVAEG